MLRQRLVLASVVVVLIAALAEVQPVEVLVEVEVAVVEYRKLGGHGSPIVCGSG
jgi:hypothetical protein